MNNLSLRFEIALVLTLILIAGCSTESTNTAQKKQTTKIYSASTQREFEEIEKTDVLHPSAAKQNRPAQKTTISPKEMNREMSKELPKKMPKEIEAPTSPELVAMSKLSTKNQERLQEINQNLAFYCMKHRKDPSFLSEEKCLAFTQKVLDSCEKKHKLIYTVMVNCIKQRLKKRN
ncbi:MAG: hypothetical protein ACXVCE_06315 [Bacteriovorax sp.]